MVIQVEIQNKPDFLRTCRWRIRGLGNDTEWTHGYFHMFYLVNESGLCLNAALETENGLMRSYPLTAIEMQFTDKGGRGCTCDCDCTTPAADNAQDTGIE